MTELSENETSNVETILAMPTLAMLPAANYNLNISKESYALKVPCEGKYVEVDPEYFTEDDGEFIVYKDNTFYIATLTKVLFATKQYPKLADNQLFCPISATKQEDEVLIIGRLVTIVGE